MSYFFHFFFQSDMSLNEIMTLSHTDFFFMIPVLAKNKTNKSMLPTYVITVISKSFYNKETMRTSEHFVGTLFAV